MEQLRDESAALVERWVDVIDDLYRDPDMEEDDEVGIEDMPHDQADEGNDEPWLATAEDGNTQARGWGVDGEVDEAPEDGAD